MFRSKKSWLLAPLFVLLSTTNGFGAALSFTSPNTPYLDGTNRLLGWDFTVSGPTSVTSLGWHDFNSDGLVLDHQVGIGATSTQTLLGSATVHAGTVDPLVGFFRYATLSTSIELVSGVTYTIAGLDLGNGDAHVWDNFIGGYSST